MKRSQVLVLFGLIFISVAALICASDQNDRKPYIIYMGELPGAETSVVDDHHSLLLHAIGDAELARESRIHSYQKSLNGFVARLLPHEAKKLLNKDGVISVFESTKRELHTTRSWDFLGMHNLPKGRFLQAESNVVVGVMDTGIWIDAPSFSDKGYGPSPAKWRGKCMRGANFTGCNKKVIGAKFFHLDNSDAGTEEINPSPVDNDGHGTHTASTIAGSPVKGASLYGIAGGTARGGVPSARIAVYKVCWFSGCTDMDLLAAFDEAISDGVDIISLSIGGPPRDFWVDPIAIGAFHAMKKGILTSCSAGNSGPFVGTVQNVAPWIMTVAASSIDRQLNTVVDLGNGKKAYGINTINTFSAKKKTYPLISGTRASNLTANSYGNASACDMGTISEKKVKGKIVFCLGYNGQDNEIKEMGGAGVIATTDEDLDYSTLTLLPANIITSGLGIRIDRYINSTKNPIAVIHKTVASKVPAPFLASFSGKGPQTVTRNLLKPDIAAPGINILAAYSKLATITGDPTDTRHALFNIVSGTSMSCPHAASAAAYVRAFHPEWSPAAIKSALMTTATPIKIRGEEEQLGTGAGQINPTKSVRPGLIYDITQTIYINFLCKQGYDDTMIGLLVGARRFKCSNMKVSHGTDGLNYPTMFVQLVRNSSPVSAVFFRTVTNVGSSNSIYKSNITGVAGSNLSVKVIPDVLKFTKIKQKLSFKVVVRGGPLPHGTEIVSGLLKWSDSKYVVRSPILVYQPLRY